MHREVVCICNSVWGIYVCQGLVLDLLLPQCALLSSIAKLFPKFNESSVN